MTKLAVYTIGGLLIPAMAAGMYLYLDLGHSEEEVAAVEEVPPPKIAKNPNKVANAPAADAPPATPTPLPVGEYPTSALLANPVTQVPNLRPVIKFSATTNAPAGVPRTFPVINLSADELARLGKAYESNEAVKAAVDRWMTKANQALNSQPQPIESLSQGPGYDREAFKRAMTNLEEIASLRSALVGAKSPQMIQKAHENLVAWAKTYKPIGDAYSDRLLEPVIELHAAVHATMRPEEKEFVDSWLVMIADRQVTEATTKVRIDDLWFAHHLRVVAVIGYALGNPAYQDYTKKKFVAHFGKSIYENGVTTTYDKTKSMALHLEHLASLLRISILIQRAGDPQFDVLPFIGSRFGKSIEFALPSLQGAEVHSEFKGMTDPILIAKRDSKQTDFSERKFEPVGATEFFDVVGYFRPSVADIGPSKDALPPRFTPIHGLWYSVMNRDVSKFDRPLKIHSPVAETAHPQAPAQPEADTQVQAQAPPAQPPTTLPEKAPVVAPAQPPANPRQPASP